MNSDGGRSRQRQHECERPSGAAPATALAEALRKAVAATDEAWYRDMARNDPRGCPLTPAEMDSVVTGSIGAAEMLAAPLLPRFGGDPQALAAELGLTMLREPGATQFPPVFGLWFPAEKRIVLFEDPVTIISAFLRENKVDNLFETAKLRAAAAFHELFHALEDERADLYTRSAMLRRKLFGLIPHRRGVPAASEIGAVHFSRMMTGMTHSPRAFERCLLLAMGRMEADEAAPLP